MGAGTWQHRCGGESFRVDAATVVFFSSRRRHTRFDCDWSSDVCSSDLVDRCHDLALTEALLLAYEGHGVAPRSLGAAWARLHGLTVPEDTSEGVMTAPEIGRASCRERV